MKQQNRPRGRSFPIAIAPVAMALAVTGALAVATPVMAQTSATPAPAPSSAPTASAPPATTTSTTTMSATTTPTPGKPASAMVEKQIATMHTRLKITPQEDAQWQAFAQVMRDNANTLDALYQQRSNEFATLNAVDGLKTYAAIAQAHADGVQKLVPAFTALYDAMTPDQQKNADAVFRYQAERAQKRVQSKATAPAHGTATHG